MWKLGGHERIAVSQRATPRRCWPYVFDSTNRARHDDRNGYTVNEQAVHGRRAQRYESGSHGKLSPFLLKQKRQIKPVDMDASTARREIIMGTAAAHVICASTRSRNPRRREESVVVLVQQPRSGDLDRFLWPAARR